MPEKQPSPKAKVKPPSILLKADDAAIWDIATQDVTRLQQKGEVPPTLSRARPIPAPQKTGRIFLETPAPQKIIHPESSFQIDAGLKKKFERGDLPLDGQIDLHGMTVEQAHKRFKAFVLRKAEQGARFLLVITGKGSRGEGRIRTGLPLWCEDADLHPFILQYKQARPQHGGDGAFYILLRRKRS